MRNLRLTGLALAAGLLFTGSSVSGAETTKSDTVREETTKTTKTVRDKPGNKKSESETAVAADNTGINKRDRDDSEKTADQAKNTKSDLELTAEIRRAVVDDKALSTNAHNVKIIVENGKVTLKGPVASAAEKASIAKKASTIAGKGKVVDEMAVAP